MHLRYSHDIDTEAEKQQVQLKDSHTVPILLIPPLNPVPNAHFDRLALCASQAVLKDVERVTGARSVAVTRYGSYESETHTVPILPLSPVPSAR